MGRLWIVVGLVVLALAVGGGAWMLSLSQPVTAAGTPTAAIPAESVPAVPPAPNTTAPTGAQTPGAVAPTQPGQTQPGATSVPTTTSAAPPKSADPSLSYSNVAINATSKSGTTHNVIIAVEKGTGLKANTIAQAIGKTLNDPRSWAGSGHVRFPIVKDATKAEITIAVMTTPTSVSACGGAAVCWKTGTVVIDAARWDNPPGAYTGDKIGFQRYLVNHGIGFAIGNKTFPCLKPGANANVMQAQDGDLGGCKANPWVYP